MEDFAAKLQRDLHARYSHKMFKWYEIVDWTEPLIVGLLATHAVLLATVFWTRHQHTVQFALFLSIMLLLFMTQRLNAWAREHWRLFATQQYFDERGVFMAIFYAAPLLAIGFFQLLLTMKSLVSMLIIVKRAEFRQQLQQKAKKTQ
ncbi:hypothetical protein P43SY_005770 [Pythium insidiosum]|uniref:Transmembrane protein 18 n=1 Tax=Pythium insidiosum TaxID=114742 RepID=A0AAD5MC92_PYTIN|nr:hypothetical protein P43SY_005770 [Pythium insidiosum]